MDIFLVRSTTVPKPGIFLFIFEFTTNNPLLSIYCFLVNFVTNLQVYVLQSQPTVGRSQEAVTLGKDQVMSVKPLWMRSVPFWKRRHPIRSPHWLCESPWEDSWRGSTLIRHRLYQHHDLGLPASQTWKILSSAYSLVSDMWLQWLPKTKTQLFQYIYKHDYTFNSFQ